MRHDIPLLRGGDVLTRREFHRRYEQMPDFKAELIDGVEIESRRVHWFARTDGGLAPLEPDRSGAYRSRVFPGLWLDSRAYFAEDGKKLLATLNRGMKTAEHST